MGAPLEFRAMERSEEDLIAFQECFARDGTSRRLDALRWQYLENPTGELFVDLAISNGRVVSIYAVQPTVVRVGETQTVAAQSVDTLVDAEFRGRGLFTTMADGLYGRVRTHEGAFIYGFPNANSAPGFFKKLGWSSLDPVPFLVRPLRTAFLSSKLPLGKWLRRLPDVRVPIGRPRLRANQEFRQVTDFGRGLDALWKRFASSITVAVERSPEYLGWRLRKPGEHYECLGVYEDTEIVAFCAYTTVDKHGGRIGYVIELLHEPDDHATGAALLAESLGRMAESGADAVLAWAFGHSPNAKAYSKAGFLPLPDRLRPIELHVGVRPLDESLTDAISDRRSWYISYCDSDTV